MSSSALHGCTGGLSLPSSSRPPAPRTAACRLRLEVRLVPAVPPRRPPPRRCRRRRRASSSLIESKPEPTFSSSSPAARRRSTRRRRAATALPFAPPPPPRGFAPLPAAEVGRIERGLSAAFHVGSGAGMAAPNASTSLLGVVSGGAANPAWPSAAGAAKPAWLGPAAGAAATTRRESLFAAASASRFCRSASAICWSTGFLMPSMYSASLSTAA